MRIVFIIALSLALQSCNTKDSLTSFSEENKMDREYYLYPSTLRMINLQQTEEFNDVIEDFVLAKYFSLSNNKENSILISELKTKMIDEGYEEAMILKNKENDISIYVLNRKTPLISAIMEMDSSFNLVQIEGMINITKIPKLIEEFEEDDYINIWDFIQTERNNAHHEHHSQD